MATIPLDFNVLLLAPLAPVIGITALWLLQLAFIETDKRMLGVLRKNHEPLARFTNFTGVLFQTLCHALGYTVTRSGIAHFQVSVNDGSVEPRRKKTGAFEWTSTLFLFLGPFFVPAGLLLACSTFLLTNGFAVPRMTQYTFEGMLTALGGATAGFTKSLGGFLGSIDLLNPFHILFLLLLLFLGLGIRPSYIGEKHREKVDLLYDLKNVTMHFIRKPLYILAFFAGVYLIFYVSLAFHENWFLTLFSVLGWLAVLGIIALVLGFLLLSLLWASDHIAAGWRALPFLALPIAYGSSRTAFAFFKVNDILGLSLLLMVVSTVAVTLVLIKYKTNRFKTRGKMKHMRVADGKKGVSEK
jgi:hypothetical protein